ncbi:AMP-binding protein [Cupriavidus numazuensis]|uniref:3-[(3aS,4S,7aS)-7a-methyl-1, 5-dioxo-octahydro-1H-inden-4-yl]propanoyl:CoA ligase n=1 Tax=Cupriavidus numazuensis TaxID=221992 RepID=A0ABM8TLY8_9BURK|nr:AMP-binding protein [Cupriavidus numazuensis]CAG2154116.1 3-[(3aS,4S,7aS)-7a-methyl-1, 5-dioxo-octahydro-1H-inden-4-yl]propanoyl:CoA ligase [Cupriavidus numazuensis]
MIEDTLFHTLDTAPVDSTCVIVGATSVTYGELRTQALAIAEGLRNAGIRRGDTAALWIPNVPEWLSIAYACAKIGVRILPLNMRYGPRELEDFLSRSHAEALFYVPTYRGINHEDCLLKLDPLALQSMKVAISLGSESQELAPGAQSRTLATLMSRASVNPETTEVGQAQDPFVVFASSGTTSKPKLICHLQQSVSRHARDVDAAFEIGPDSRLLLSVPFGGAFGFTIAQAALSAHATLIVQEQFDPREAAQLLQQHRVTHMFGTDDMLDKLLDAAGNDTRFPDLKLYGHANFTPALSASLPAKAAERGIFLRGCYGLSESMALFASQPAAEPLDRRAMSGGRPTSPLGKVRIRSLESGELVAAGEAGEIEIYSPNLTVGYLNDPEATSKAFHRDGFLRTGDLGYLMPDGGVTLLSRIGDILRIGGYLVNPLEIEETVLGLGHIAACQVVAVDTAGSVRPVAFVIGKSGYAHDEASMIALCRGRLATYKTPIRIFEVDSFPITESANGGKVRKNVLKDLALRLMSEEKSSS